MSSKSNYANFFISGSYHVTSPKMHALYEESIVSAEDWAKNPDTGIPELLEQYREDNYFVLNMHDGERIPSSRKTEKKKAEKKKTVKLKSKFVSAEEKPDKSKSKSKSETKVKRSAKPKAKAKKSKTETAADKSKDRMIDPQTGQSWIETPTHKQCRFCRRILPKSEFYPRRVGSSTLRSECHECGRMLRREWYYKNKNKYVK